MKLEHNTRAQRCLLCILLASAFFAMCISLCACSEPTEANNNQQSTSVGTNEATESEQPTSSTNKHSNQQEGTSAMSSEITDTIILSVNGSELTATLEDNSSAEALVKLLEQGPLTINMEDYANMEKVGPIGRSLPRNDTPTNTEAGDIILYQGNQLVVYYGTNSWNFTPIGKIQGVSANELRSILGRGNATITFSLA